MSCGSFLFPVLSFSLGSYTSLLHNTHTQATQRLSTKNRLETFVKKASWDYNGAVGEFKRGCPDLPGKGKQKKFCEWTEERWGWEHEQLGRGGGILKETGKGGHLGVR